MNYLLDTNACIAIINDRPDSIRLRFLKVLDGGAHIWASSVVAFELWYGVAKSSRSITNAQRLSAFLGGPVGVLSFDEDDARVAGALRATLEGSGRPIAAYDLLIAAQAARRGMTLVTANVSEFRRVKGLVWEDWAKLR